nr:hypothetical protein [Mycoplasmopsis bovis]
MVLVIHLRILPHKLKVIKTRKNIKSIEIFSLKTDPTNSKTIHQKQENPTRFKVGSFYGMLPHKLKIKNKKKTVVVLVIHLRILPHKLKVIKTRKNLRVLIFFLSILPPQTQRQSSKARKPQRIQGSFFLRDATPQTKDKEQEENRSGSGNSSTDTAPQTQDIQKQENKNKRKRKNNPKDLLKQLDEIKQEYEKAKKIMKN